MRERLKDFLRRGLIQNIQALYGARGFGRWLGRGSWAVMDQGFFAGSNFVLSLLLARWLIPQDYGAFTVAYTVFWLLLSLDNALLIEPMLVFGAGKYEGRMSEYLRVLLYGNLGFAALGSLLLLLAGLVFWLSASNALSSALWGLALAGPFMRFHYLVRRACYVRLKPHLAAFGSALYMALTLFGIYVLYQSSWLSAAAAFGMMGFASCAAGLWLAVRLRVNPTPPLAATQLIHETFKDHWGYGRWAVPTNVLALLSGNIYFLLLPIWWGLEASAALRALLNFVMPVLQAVSALSNLLLPTLVRVRGRARFAYILRLTLLLFTFGAAVYGALLIIFDDSLVAWIYGGQYSEYADLLWLVGLLPTVYMVVEMLSAALRALERPDRIFLAYAFSTVTALTVGLLFLIITGVSGAVVGILVSQLTAVGAVAWFLHTSGGVSGKVQSKDDETRSRENR